MPVGNLHPQKPVCVTCGVAIMAKASIPGRTKTRLVPPLTLDEATACNTAFIRDAADSILTAAGQAPIAGYVAFGPPAFARFFRDVLPAQIGLIEAWQPTLGESLVSAIAQLLERGHCSAVVVNSDSPTLPPALLLEAAQVLAQPGERAVLGPATDGGYYLLGLKHEYPRLFQDISWSTEHVTRQTLERAAEIDLPVHFLPTWYDVDDVRALRMLRDELFEGASFCPQLPARRPQHTAAWMRSLIEHAQLLERLGRDPTAGRAAE